MDGQAASRSAVAVVEHEESQRSGPIYAAPGADGPPAELRARLIAATLELVAEGASDPRLAESVAAQAGVPEGAFYEVFERPEDCILAAFDDGLERLSSAVVETAGREERWLERIRVGLAAALAFLDREPRWASLLVLESPLEAAPVSECARRVHEALGEVLDAGQGEVIVGAQVTPSTTLIAELVVGAVLSVVRARMLNGRGASLVGLAPSLMSNIVEPYLGRGAEKADAARGVAPQALTVSEAKVVPIRPHARVMAVLRLVAAQPRLTNGEIASVVEMKDRRQASPLLMRLEKRGLIENANAGSTHNANAWTLTPYGHRVIEVLADGAARARRLEDRDGVPGRALRRGSSPPSSRRPRFTAEGT